MRHLLFVILIISLFASGCSSSPSVSEARETLAGTLARPKNLLEFKKTGGRESVSPIGKKYYHLDWEGVIAEDNGQAVEKQVIRGTFRYVMTDKGWQLDRKRNRSHRSEED